MDVPMHPKVQATLPYQRRKIGDVAPREVCVAIRQAARVRGMVGYHHRGAVVRAREPGFEEGGRARCIARTSSGLIPSRERGLVQMRRQPGCPPP